MSVSRDWGADVLRLGAREARDERDRRDWLDQRWRVRRSEKLELRTSNSPQSSLLQTAELPCEKITGCLHVVRDIGL